MIIKEGKLIIVIVMNINKDFIASIASVVPFTPAIHKIVSHVPCLTTFKTWVSNNHFISFIY